MKLILYSYVNTICLHIRCYWHLMVTPLVKSGQLYYHLKLMLTFFTVWENSGCPTNLPAYSHVLRNRGICDTIEMQLCIGHPCMKQESNSVRHSQTAQCLTQGLLLSGNFTQWICQALEFCNRSVLNLIVGQVF